MTIPVTYANGAVVIDDSGIVILAPEDFNKEIKFVTEDGTEIAAIDAGWTDGVQSGLVLQGKGRTSSEVGYAAVRALNDDETEDCYMYVVSNGLALVGVNSSVVQLHKGWEVTYNKVATTTETSVATHTLGANTMGANGRIHLRAHVLIKNNKGTSGTAGFIFYFGSKSITLPTFTINNSATTRSVFIFDIEVVNDNATNAQHITLQWEYLENLAAESTGASAANLSKILWTTAAIDTTVAVDMKLNIDLSATDANFFSESSGEFDGPHPAIA